ncbi:hypothetical protein [Frankia sp. AvcI1]|uniref:hypothetical protein n=1 Tax=Frankia sp. AvcI1 TaxID=573496 RepID=UPI0012FE6BE5|nr:hypothetical protein [Frankia sp. AvcI1]
MADSDECGGDQEDNKIYVKCLDGEELRMRGRIEKTLGWKPACLEQRGGPGEPDQT